MEKLTKIEELAGKFVAAEISSRSKDCWMHYANTKEISNMVKFSVKLAKEVIKEANKPC